MFPFPSIGGAYTLHMVAYSGHLEAVSLLEQTDANVNAQDFSLCKISC